MLKKPTCPNFLRGSVAPSITRRDFLGSTLLASGAVLLRSDELRRAERQHHHLHGQLHADDGGRTGLLHRVCDVLRRRELRRFQQSANQQLHHHRRHFIHERELEPESLDLRPVDDVYRHHYRRVRRGEGRNAQERAHAEAAEYRRLGDVELEHRLRHDSGDWPYPGTATCVTTSLNGGTDTITTNYSGDSNRSSSSGTLSGGQVVNKASQMITFTTAPPSSAGYYAAAPELTPTVNATKGTPVINWPTPASINYGRALSSTQLDATATSGTGSSITGTYKYTPTSGHFLNAGAQTLSVTFTPTGMAKNDFTTATASVMLQVNQATTATTITSSDQTVTLNKAGTAGQRWTST